ncbi:uncharacterized protein Z519_07747 [Cladophialophora bantiana CBS 173.52]|uniref:Xylanolytic transcriptional activator regulatory domain-containing protein n=1 Tax=Cladophialophora bantiana (strain ATCC 10958 / CBS 173.52 / CDC B-1940 / NIH 8579) TaxID=1442370 RepID=A0A0D2FZ86_CLAB1|nr:uncharacterized protein Z519_07747 [Cladophialophora bantiana CBS 173.52]KIW91777.1 hypothetical protein Z519_07747 [Cladophialophora bantiana CBS 173.52]
MSLQSILENGFESGHHIRRKVQIFQSALEEIADKLSMPELLQRLKATDNTTRVREDLHQGVMGEKAQSSNTNLRDDRATGRWEVVLDLQSGLGDVPGSCVSHISPPEASRPYHDNVRYADIISEGVLSQERAESYFFLYKQRLDHFIYRVPGDWFQTLDNVRQCSPLLTSVICAVGALHSTSADYDVCYGHFTALAARKLFAKEHTVFDVLAFLIGAYWLSDISWNLISIAVRIATELQLHRAIYHISDGDKSRYLCARVYYLVFVCDHHFSIPYGRYPWTRQCEAIKLGRQLLSGPHSTKDDLRLVYQVELWSLTEEISTTFGTDTDRALTVSMVPDLHRFSIQLDSFRTEWNARWVPNAFIGNYARKGSGLYYHFAKLYLYSHALRGLGKHSSLDHDVSQLGLDIDEFANAAVLSATTIIRTVINDGEVQSFIDGFHTYFNIMIVFAVVFLLKVSAAYSVSIHLDKAEIASLVERLLVVLKRSILGLHPKHLLVSISNGIEQALNNFSMNLRHDPGNHTNDTGASSANVPTGNAGGYEVFSPFMEDFDFLASQSLINNFPADVIGEDLAS